MRQEDRMQKNKPQELVKEKACRPFGLRDKLGYLFGDFGNDFSFIFASTYLMVFYTKVLGISGAVVGTLFLAARGVDAFTDITMGRIADRFPAGKEGRFRPWIRRMCVPVAVSSSAMYLYFVKDWPYGGRLAYMVITYLVWGSFCYTAINIPYGSMASVISQEPKDRAALSTFRSLGASFASLVIGSVVPLIIYRTDEAGNQTVNAVAFTVIAVIFSILSIVCYLLCYFLCTERVLLTGRTGQKEGEAKEAGGSVLTRLFHNRALLAIVGAALVLLLATMLSQTMNSYLFLDYFRHAKALSWVNLVSISGMLLVAPVASKIAAAVGKKEAGAVAMLVSGLIYLLLFFLRVKSILTFMVFLFLGTLGMGFFNMITWAYITDVIDYQEIQTGKREDGTVYAVYSFARKVGQALAGGTGGFALSAIGYISEAVSQTQEVAERIYTMATLVPGICYFLIALILWFMYPLNRQIVEENTKLLSEKRKKEAEGDVACRRET